jgi:hypothetical protein
MPATPNQLGVDTDLMRSEAFRPYQDHVRALVDRLAEVPTVGSVVPHPDGELDDSVVKLVQDAIGAVNGLMELMPILTEGDGANVDTFARIAQSGEDENVATSGKTFVA